MATIDLKFNAKKQDIFRKSSEYLGEINENHIKVANQQRKGLKSTIRRCNKAEPKLNPQIEINNSPADINKTRLYAGRHFKRVEKVAAPRNNFRTISTKSHLTMQTPSYISLTPEVHQLLQITQKEMVRYKRRLASTKQKCAENRIGVLSGRKINDKFDPWSVRSVPEKGETLELRKMNPNDTDLLMILPSSQRSTQSSPFISYDFNEANKANEARKFLSGIAKGANNRSKFCSTHELFSLFQAENLPELKRLIRNLPRKLIIDSVQSFEKVSDTKINNLLQNYHSQMPGVDK